LSIKTKIEKRSKERRSISEINQDQVETIRSTQELVLKTLFQLTEAKNWAIVEVKTQSKKFSNAVRGQAV
jgi:hypothetical protein